MFPGLVMADEVLLSPQQASSHQYFYWWLFVFEFGALRLPGGADFLWAVWLLTEELKGRSLWRTWASEGPAAAGHHPPLPGHGML